MIKIHFDEKLNMLLLQIYLESDGEHFFGYYYYYFDYVSHVAIHRERLRFGSYVNRWGSYRSGHSSPHVKLYYNRTWNEIGSFLLATPNFCAIVIDPSTWSSRAKLDTTLDGISRTCRVKTACDNKSKRNENCGAWSAWLLYYFNFHIVTAPIEM